MLSIAYMWTCYTKSFYILRLTVSTLAVMGIFSKWDPPSRCTATDCLLNTVLPHFTTAYFSQPRYTIFSQSVYYGFVMRCHVVRSRACLTDQPIIHKGVVSRDRLSLVTGSFIFEQELNICSFKSRAGVNSKFGITIPLLIDNVYSNSACPVPIAGTTIQFFSMQIPIRFQLWLHFLSSAWLRQITIISLPRSNTSWRCNYLWKSHAPLARIMMFLAETCQ